MFYPRIFPIFSVPTRATTSLEPPAGNGGRLVELHRDWALIAVRWARRPCKERASTAIARVTGGSGRGVFIF
jgi:hypothetical protein